MLPTHSLSLSHRMSHGNRFLFKNGVISPAADTPSVATFLEAHPGAYTTTRTHNNGSEIIFWERHLLRLSNSFKLLWKENPKLVLRKPEVLSSQVWESLARKLMCDSVIQCLVNDSMRKVMTSVVKERRFGEELAITTLLSGNMENSKHFNGGFDEGEIYKSLDVYLHVDGYVPPLFGVRENAARLAVVGRGRDLAIAKYSDWVRLLEEADKLRAMCIVFDIPFLGRRRKCLEKLRPPSTTELLLSNDGERILEGCLTNFFVVCLKEKHGEGDTAKHTEPQTLRHIEVQTAPVSDGVLPGVLRQAIRDVCLEIGIPFREVAPSWSERELWTEAFITNSLRILQHVETIQAPNAWESVESKTWEEITWVQKRFEDAPGKITSMLQEEVLRKLDVEAFAVTEFEEKQPPTN